MGPLSGMAGSRGGPSATPADTGAAARGLVGREDLLAALGALTSVPAPRGSERDCAVAVHAFAARRWPALRWLVDPLSAQDGGRGAGLVGESGSGGAPDLLICSHLDTSLSGVPDDDWPVNGPGPAPARGFELEGDRLRGFGLAVARAPAAAALVAHAAAARALTEAELPHRLGLLLAGSGTHRSPFGGPGAGAPELPGGVARRLAGGRRPAAVLIAKCGPYGILYEEPGACFLRVRLTTRPGAVLARAAATPSGGLPTHLGTLIGAAEKWRTEWTTAPGARGGQVAREVGIGAVRCGAPHKPDLLPAVADLHLYAVLAPGDEPAAVAALLRDRLAAALAGGPLEGCALTVDHSQGHPAGRTSPTASIVRAAHDAWTLARGGLAPTPTGWTGSTDGVMFRVAGVDTVRLGPHAASDPSDPRLDLLSLTELLDFARMYADIAVRWATGHGGGAKGR